VKSVRTHLLALIGIVIAIAPLTAPPATAVSSATVFLRVGPEGFAVPNHWLVDNPSVWLIDPLQFPESVTTPGYAGCVLSVSDADADGRVDGAELLDTARDAGCITDWASQDTAFGRFVTTIDGLEQTGGGLVTWWFLQLDGKGATSGIDDWDLQDGTSVDAIYYLGPL